MAKKAVVLLSGGLDSTVALWWAQKKGYQCTALTFGYGQRHVKELDVAKRIAKIAKIPHYVVNFSLPWSSSSLTDKKKKLPHQKIHKIAQNIPSTYVPGRNTVFLSFALSLVDQQNAGAIVIGANAVDYSGYPDCRGPYLRYFEKVATLGSRVGTQGKKSVKILSPLLHLTKSKIILLGQKLHAPIDMTWSCYQGGAHPCGTCDSCQLRQKGFNESHRKNAH